MILQQNLGPQSVPMLPAEITRCLPHGCLTVGINGVPEDTHMNIDGLIDTGAQASTYKQSVIVECARVFPHHVKEITDSADGKYKAVPLDEAVGDGDVLPSVSTFLPVIVVLYTPWIGQDGSPVYLTFACGECLSIRCITGMPMLLDMGPAVIDLNSNQIMSLNWTPRAIDITMKEPIDAPLPLDNMPMKNKITQVRARSNVKAVHTAITTVLARHMTPIHNIRSNSTGTSGYGSFNSTINPIFDLATTLPAQPDLAPGSAIAPEVPAWLKGHINTDIPPVAADASGASTWATHYNSKPHVTPAGILPAMETWTVGQ